MRFRWKKVGLNRQGHRGQSFHAARSHRRAQTDRRLERAVERGRYVRLAQGVYLKADRPPRSFEIRLAQALRTGQRISGELAAALHGFDGFDAPIDGNYANIPRVSAHDLDRRGAPSAIDSALTCAAIEPTKEFYVKVFVSPKYPFTNTDSRLPGTVAGELVTPWTCGVCVSDGCPHIGFIGFIGLESHGVSSYARIVERADVDEFTLALMLKADPNSHDPRTGQLDKDVCSYLEFVARETIDFASHYEVGQMVERCIGGVVGVTTK